MVHRTCVSSVAKENIQAYQAFIAEKVEDRIPIAMQKSAKSAVCMQIFLNPTNTVYDAKRLVGRKFSEQDVQDDIANMNWPFTIRKGGGDKPTIRGNLTVFCCLSNGPLALEFSAFMSTIVHASNF